MIIGNLRSESSHEGARVMATITWEDSDRPSQDIYFETDSAFAHALTCNPHSFLVACAMPAMRHRERRMFIDAAIDPRLHNGLTTAMNWIRHWQGPERRLLRIEARTSDIPLHPNSPERAGLFMSGGIDSLGSLCANRIDFAREHPGSFKDALFIQGIERDKDIGHFVPALQSLTEIVAQDPDLTLIPVRTNIRELDNDSYFWGMEFQGAALAAVAHAFARRLTSVAIPATADMFHLHPYGSHPLLDPNYSSSDLQILHDGITLSRLTKTALVADCAVALQHVRVCNNPKAIPPGSLNCGQCEKCLRTKLALLALGKLDQTRAFPSDGPSNETLLKSLKIKNRASRSYQESCYQELITPLTERGHAGLARQVEQFIARSRAADGQHTKKIRIRAGKERLKDIDRKYIGGGLRRILRALGLRSRKPARD